MLDDVLGTLLASTTLIVLTATAALFRRPVRWKWAPVAVLLVAFDRLAVTGMFGLLPAWPVMDDVWNVSGKVYALILLLSIVTIARIPLGQVGLGAGRGPRRRLAWSVCLILVATLIVLALSLSGERAPASTLLYQATLPGLHEELFYRGLLLLVLDRAFEAETHGAGALTSSVVVTLLFSLAHVLLIQDGRLVVHPAGGTTPLLVGGLLIWLRRATGGLAAPILLHNSVNTVFRAL